MMRIKDRLFQQIKSTNSAIDLKVFKKLLRNQVVNELKISKNNYYHHYFDENKSNMKKLWKGIKSILSLKSNNVDKIPHVTDKNGSQIKDPVKIANQFNQYFTNDANNIAKNIPRNPRSPLSFLANPNDESFFIFPCTSCEVSEVIKSLKNAKFSAPNSIPIKLLKILDPFILLVYLL